MYRTSALILLTLGLFILYVAVVTGDITPETALMCALPFIPAFAIAGFLVGSESEGERHEDCYAEACSHKREMIASARERRRRPVASHRKVHA